MNDCIHPLVYVHPGALFAGSGPRCVRTLLGSCVAVVLWNRRLRRGGMCHFVLPQARQSDAEPDARYGTDAVPMLLERVGGAAAELEVGLYGGGNMFPGMQSGAGLLVGEQNVATARSLLASRRLRVEREDVCGAYYRNVYMDLAAGVVRVVRTAVGGGIKGA